MSSLRALALPLVLWWLPVAAAGQAEWEDDAGGQQVVSELRAGVHDGRIETERKGHEELGSRALFRSGFDVGYTFRERHRLMASFSHISNGGTALPNQDLDTLGVRYGFRFQ